MRNYYYVVSLNMTNPIVKSMLDKQGLSSVTMVDFKMRSKLFMSYQETLNAALADFDNKLTKLYVKKGEHFIGSFTLSNPAVLTPESDVMAAMIAKFGGNYLNDWDENCASVIFFAENPDGDGEKAVLNATSWMVKYEVLFTDDAIELTGNGDFAFEPMNVPKTQFSSAYH